MERQLGRDELCGKLTGVCPRELGRFDEWRRRPNYSPWFGDGGIKTLTDGTTNTILYAEHGTVRRS